MLESEATATALPLCEVTLAELAVEIKGEHDAAEYDMRNCVMHARRAGVKLIEVKNRLEHGAFMPWVKTHCEFSQSTANLYMKIAKRWDVLGNSQQVANLTLRQACELLYMDPAEEHADAAGELVNLGLLDWRDLDGLEPLETRALVTAARRYYEQYCYEPDEALLAERVKMPQEWQPVMTCNRRTVRFLASKAATDLRVGRITKQQVLKHLYPPAAKLTRANASHGKQNPGPFDSYVERTTDFIDATHALLKSRGLLKKALTLSDSQREQLLALMADVREALDGLEGDVRRSEVPSDGAEGGAKPLAIVGGHGAQPASVKSSRRPRSKRSSAV